MFRYIIIIIFEVPTTWSNARPLCGDLAGYCFANFVMADGIYALFSGKFPAPVRKYRSNFSLFV